MNFKKELGNRAFDIVDTLSEEDKKKVDKLQKEMDKMSKESDLLNLKSISVGIGKEVDSPFRLRTKGLSNILNYEKKRTILQGITRLIF